MRMPIREQIKRDNEHFVGDIRVLTVQPSDEIDFEDFGFTLTMIVGCTGNQYRAAYLWHPERQAWACGMN